MNDTWEILGFNDSIFQAELLSSAPSIGLNIIGDTILCQGMQNGIIYAQVQNGSPPYNFLWSTGNNNITNTPIDSIIVGEGTYSVTITDAGGCSVSDSINIFSNPPINISLDKIDVWCKHDSTGTIMIIASGGTPPYSYVLHPNNISSTTNIFDSLPKGSYIVEIIDSYGCVAYDTIYLVELYELPPVNIMAEPTIGCQPLYTIL